MLFYSKCNYQNFTIVNEIIKGFSIVNESIKVFSIVKFSIYHISWMLLKFEIKMFNINFVKVLVKWIRN